MAMANNTEKNERILEKVRKMLALAGNNPSQEEADSALLMAQRMLAKYNMTISDIEDINDADLKEVINEGVTDYAKTPWWHKRLSYIIASNFKCKSYNNKSGGYSRIRFVGFKEDVEVAKEVFNYALEVANKKALQFTRKVRDRGESTAGVRNDYLIGFTDGLEAKFKEQVQSDKCLALAIVIPTEVTNYVESNLTLRKGRTSMVVQQGNAEAKMEGYNAGKSFNMIKGHIQ